MGFRFEKYSWKVWIKQISIQGFAKLFKKKEKKYKEIDG
jgi:hypothetical protein